MVHLRTLGTLRVDERGSAPLTQSKRLALLAYLAAARPHGFHRRDTLLALFWPESTDEHARSALSQALLRLRSTVGTDVVLSRGTTEVGVDLTRLWCDVVAFTQHIATGEEERALQLYQGDFLQGVHLSGLVDFERWVEDERAHLRAVAARAAWIVAEREERTHRTASAAQWARRAVELGSHDEIAVRRYLQLLTRVGDHAGAVAAYDDFARRLRVDYGIEPSAETRGLIESLRSLASTKPFESPPVGALPTPSQSLAGPAARPRRFPRAASLFGGIAALALVATLGRFAAPGETLRAAHDPARVAVFPFTYRGTTELDYLGEGMVDLLSVAFDGAGDVRRVDPFALMTALNSERSGALDPERARAIARRFNAALFVLGSVVSADTVLVVSASLYDTEAPAQPIGIAEQRGPVSALPSLIDALATELLRDRLEIDEGGRSQQAIVATRTTTSLVALKHYLTGERNLRAGRYGDAASQYDDAITADSTFALAYLRLGVALSNGASSRFGWSPPEAMGRATRHGARLARRDRITLAAIDAYWLRQDPQEAMRLLRGLVQQYPDDVEAWWRLAEMDFHYGMRAGRPLEDVRATLLRASELDSSNMGVLIELRWLANTEENAVEDERLSRRMLALAPESDFRQLMLLDIALIQGDATGVRRTLHATRKLGGLLRLLYVDQYAMHSDDVAGMREAATLLTSPDNASFLRLAGHKMLAHFLAARGQWGAAQQEIAAMLPLDRDAALQTLGILSLSPAAPGSSSELRDVQQRLTVWDPTDAAASVRRSYLLGLLAARIGDHADALAKAEALVAQSRNLLLRDSAAFLGAEARDRALSVQAQSALIRGEADEAVRYLEQARPEQWWVPVAAEDLFGNWSYERFMRAEALRQLGRDDEAVHWYRALRLIMWERVFDNVKRLRLGNIAERAGDLRAAAGHYNRVIALGAARDSGLPDYDREARLALARVLARGTSTATKAGGH